MKRIGRIERPDGLGIDFANFFKYKDDNDFEREEGEEACSSSPKQVLFIFRETLQYRFASLVDQCYVYFTLEIYEVRSIGAKVSA